MVKGIKIKIKYSYIITRGLFSFQKQCVPSAWTTAFASFLFLAQGLEQSIFLDTSASTETL